MSRTDEIRGKGKERAGSGGSGGAPFVRWGDSYAWIEGQVTGSFETKYGLAATLKVSATGGATLEVQGQDEDGNKYDGQLKVGQEVNVGTQSATLAGKITKDDVGKSFHVAFEGWEQGKQNKYRVFVVVEITGARAAPPSDAPPPDRWKGEPEPRDDGLPF